MWCGARKALHPVQVALDPLRWGLIPHFCEEPKGGRQADQCQVRNRSHGADVPRCLPEAPLHLCPSDGFFEWKAIKGKAKQPYAIAMKDGYPFGLGGIWEN